MSALEWLDAVRADLDAATPGPWTWHARSTADGDEWAVWEGDTQNVVATNRDGWVPDAALIASAPDRLDQMERALRAVLDLAVAVNAAAIIPTSEPIMNAGYRVALGDVVTAIKEELGDE